MSGTSKTSADEAGVGGVTWVASGATACVNTNGDVSCAVTGEALPFAGGGVTFMKLSGVGDNAVAYAAQGGAAVPPPPRLPFQ